MSIEVAKEALEIFAKLINSIAFWLIEIVLILILPGCTLLELLGPFFIPLNNFIISAQRLSYPISWIALATVVLLTGIAVYSLGILLTATVLAWLKAEEKALDSFLELDAAEILRFMRQSTSSLAQFLQSFAGLPAQGTTTTGPSQQQTLEKLIETAKSNIKQHRREEIRSASFRLTTFSALNPQLRESLVQGTWTQIISVRFCCGLLGGIPIWYMVLMYSAYRRDLYYWTDLANRGHYGLAIFCLTVVCLCLFVLVMFFVYQLMRNIWFGSYYSAAAFQLQTLGTQAPQAAKPVSPS